ncbi:hypothetical protein [Caenimonas aquaedulcis]|uniref:Uncharacterized protein n=1 Tax=Caenimonas aquaedulcis TaxID=2793270 RepID=A0A931MG81_9BURK|nr:hypothetical protein [Caenimonas aquaedulcis]MBG9387065.1 hypothetical protein [Caenimonas aquaedulcis]
MDRITPPATAALTEASSNAGKPRRRWWDGPNYPWSTQTEEQWSVGAHWPQLCAALSEQVASEANAIRREMKRLHADRGIDRAELAAADHLAQSIRRAGTTVQQIVRLAAGGVQPKAELVDLPALAKHVVNERRALLARRHAEIRLDLQPADVYVDAAVALEVMNAAVDWALGFSSQVELGVEPARDGGPVRLMVTGDRAAPPRDNPTAPTARRRRMNDSLDWLLLRQLAVVTRLKVFRATQGMREIAFIEFPRTYATMDGVATVELLPGAQSESQLKDARVLLMIRNKPLRQKVLRLLLANGLQVSVADSVELARPLCQKDKPRAIVSCHEFIGPAYIRDGLDLDGSRCAVVQITLARPSFQASGFHGHECVRVGRGDVEKELIPALLFELAQQE